MTTERSDRVYENWRTSAEKFDYFVLGILGALCAYIANNFEPGRLGVNPKTLELIALVSFFASAVLGFVRVEATVLLTSLNHRYLRLNEQRGSLTQQLQSGRPFLNSATGQIYAPQDAQAEIFEINRTLPKIDQQMASSNSRAEFAYSWRNRLVLIGFLVLIGARVWGAYYHAV